MIDDSVRTNHKTGDKKISKNFKENRRKKADYLEDQMFFTMILDYLVYELQGKRKKAD